MLFAIRQFIGKKALIIQPGALGDTILTLPLLELLHSQLGIEHIDLMGHTDYIRVFHLENNENTDSHKALPRRLLSIDQAQLHLLFTDSEQFDLPEGHQLIDLFQPYELIISFLNDTECNFEHNLIYTSSLTHSVEVITLDIKPPDDWPEHVTRYFIRQISNQLPGMQLTTNTELTRNLKIQPSQHHIQQAREILADQQLNPDKPVIVMHPGSGGKHKCWPLQYFHQLAQKCRSHFGQVIIIAGPTERDRWDDDIFTRLSDNATVFNDLSIEQVAAIIALSSGYVGNDSGVSHLAGLMRVPAVAIFGPTSVKHYKPLGNKVLAISSNDNQWPGVDEVFGTLQRLCSGNNDNN